MLSGLHATVGVVVVVANALAAGWGAVAWTRRDPSVAFWYLLRFAQATVVVQVGLGVALLMTGRETPDALHLLYGISPLAVALVSEGMRVGAAHSELADVEDVDALERREQVLLARRVVLREMGVMTVGTLLILTLTLRAAGIF